VKLADLKYKDPIYCPHCGKVLGYWVEFQGKAIIQQYCKRCKREVYIKKSVDFLKEKSQ